MKHIQSNMLSVSIEEIRYWRARYEHGEVSKNNMKPTSTTSMINIIKEIRRDAETVGVGHDLLFCKLMLDLILKYNFHDDIAFFDQNGNTIYAYKELVQHYDGDISPDCANTIIPRLIEDKQKFSVYPSSRINDYVYLHVENGEWLHYLPKGEK